MAILGDGFNAKYNGKIFITADTETGRKTIHEHGNEITGIDFLSGAEITLQKKSCQWPDIFISWTMGEGSVSPPDLHAMCENKKCTILSDTITFKFTLKLTESEARKYHGDLECATVTVGDEG